MHKYLDHRWIAGVMVAIYVCVQCYCIPRLSINYDEELFANYGTTLIKLQGEKDIVKFDSKLPVTALNMLPRAVQQLIHPGLKKTEPYQDVIWGRYISLIATIILALVIYHWSALMYGRKAAVCSLFVFLLCPNFLAHGIFVSSDIFACLFMTTALYFLWQFGNTRLIKDFIFSSLFVGLAQVSKFSMVHLLILFPVLLTVQYVSGKRDLPAHHYSLKKFISLVFLFAGINWFIISAAHLFYGMFVPLNNYQFRSTTFQHLQSLFHFAGHYLPVLLPSTYIRSMDAVIYFDQLGGGVAGSLNGSTYLLGNNSVHGFWYYYFIVLLYKLPLPVLLLLIVTTVVYIKTYSRNKFIADEIYLIVPALYYFIYMDFFYSTQVGIRHIMIVLPLLYIYTGFFVQQSTTPAARYFSYALFTWQCISVGMYFPHFLPYTNELIPDKKMAYKNSRY